MSGIMGENYDLGAAIKTLFQMSERGDQTSAQVIQIKEYCEEIALRPMGWAECLKAFCAAEETEVRFWCIQKLTEQLYRLDLASRVTLRTHFLSYLAESISKRWEPFPIKVKMSILYVELIRSDYPQIWPSAFSDLMCQIESNWNPILIDLFITVLEIIDQEVVSDEVPQTPEQRTKNTELKDAMRLYDVPKIVETCLRIISSPTLRDNHPSIVANCLDAAAKLVSWVDTGLFVVAHPEFVSQAIYFIDWKAENRTAAMSPDDGPIQQQENHSCSFLALDFICAIVSKHMDAARKIVVIQDIDVVPKLLRISSRLQSQDSDESFKEHFADLINTLGQQLLNSVTQLITCLSHVKDLAAAATAGGLVYPSLENVDIEALAVKGWMLVESLLPSINHYFSHTSTEVCEAVQPFLSDLCKHLKSPAKPSDYTQIDSATDTSNTATPEAHSFDCPSRNVLNISKKAVRPFLYSLMKTCLEKIQYPDWYDADCGLDTEEERHLNFLEFRVVICQLFKRLVAVDIQTTTAFLLEMCTKLTTALSEAKATSSSSVSTDFGNSDNCNANNLLLDYRPIEVVLFALYTLGEVFKDVTRLLAKDQTHPLNRCLEMLITCRQLLDYDHPEVVSLIFSVYTRFNAFFASNRHYIPLFLEHLLGNRGVRSPNTTIVGHASSSLVKFVRSNFSLCLPFAAQIIENLITALSLEAHSTANGDCAVNFNTRSGKSRSGGPELMAQLNDDKQRLYDTMGCLLGTSATCPSYGQLEKTLLLRKILIPLHSALKELSTFYGEDKEEGHCRKTLMYNNTEIPVEDIIARDPEAAARLVANVITSIANLSKGFSAASCIPLADEWILSCRICVLALSVYSYFACVRHATIFLCRRILSLLSTFNTELSHLLCSTFDSIYAFPSLSLSTPSAASLEFSLGPLEFPQICAFVSHSMVCLKADAGPQFFLKRCESPLQERQRDAVMEDGRRKRCRVTPDNFVTGRVPHEICDFNLEAAGITCQLTRIFYFHMRYWSTMDSASPDSIRDKIDFAISIVQMFLSIALYDPSSFLTSIISEQQNSGSGITSDTNILNLSGLRFTSNCGVPPFLDFLLCGCQLEYTSAVPILDLSVQTFNALILFAMKQQNAEELLTRLKLSMVLETCCQTIFSLDHSDAQQLKCTQGICVMIRICAGRDATLSENGQSEVPIICQQTEKFAASVFVDTVSNMLLQQQCSISCDVHEFLVSIFQRIIGSTTLREARDALVDLVKVVGKKKLS